VAKRQATQSSAAAAMNMVVTLGGPSRAFTRWALEVEVRTCLRHFFVDFVTKLVGQGSQIVPVHLKDSLQAILMEKTTNITLASLRHSVDAILPAVATYSFCFQVILPSERNGLVQAIMDVMPPFLASPNLVPILQGILPARIDALLLSPALEIRGCFLLFFGLGLSPERLHYEIMATLLRSPPSGRFCSTLRLQLQKCVGSLGLPHW
jgi:hypothetical protein